jgi:hypothetical protein
MVWLKVIHPWTHVNWCKFCTHLVMAEVAGLKYYGVEFTCINSAPIFTKIYKRLKNH